MEKNLRRHKGGVKEKEGKKIFPTKKFYQGERQKNKRKTEGKTRRRDGEEEESKENERKMEKGWLTLFFWDGEKNVGNEKQGKEEQENEKRESEEEEEEDVVSSYHF